VEQCLYRPHTSGEQRPGHEADFHLFPSLGMSGTVPVLPPYTSMTCAATILLSLYYSLVNSTNRETYNFVVLFSSLLPLPFHVQIFPLGTLPFI